MTNRPLLLAVLFGSVMSMAQAASPQYDTAKHEAEARYAEDRSICNDERNQGQRMKCLREAKSENTRMLADAKAKYGAQGGNMACLDCGKVTAVSVSERKGESNALGMIAGGVGGAILGNQVGGGTGKKLATVAGAVGGAYAGKKIQENANSKKIWTVQVQYDNGNHASFNFDHDPQIQRGDRVRNAGQSIQRN
jgi:outer membrane lipoprotein SlyB